MKILSAQRMDRCIGCHSCSMACARLVHGQFSWLTAGIHIKSAGGMFTGFEASLCLACDPAPCARVCPTGACTQRPGGGVKKNPELCIRCGHCATACPVDAVHVDRETGLPYVCLHCGRCVPFCPHDCLSMADIPDPALSAGFRSEPVAAAGQADTTAAAAGTADTPAAADVTEAPHAS